MVLATPAIVAKVAPLGRVADAADRVAPCVAVILLTAGLPLAAQVRHAVIVRRAARAAIAGVAARPRVAIARTAAVRGLHAIELVALALFGPGVLIDLYGTIAPHALDGTPLMGRSLGWSSLIGLGAFALVAGRQLLAPRAADRIAL